MGRMLRFALLLGCNDPSGGLLNAGSGETGADTSSGGTDSSGGDDSDQTTAGLEAGVSGLVEGTAGWAVALAWPAALAWQADAKLDWVAGNATDISTGLADDWRVNFVSPSDQACADYQIDMSVGAAIGAFCTERANYACFDGMEGWHQNSDAIAAAAVGQGLTIQMISVYTGCAADAAGFRLTGEYEAQQPVAIVSTQPNGGGTYYELSAE